MRNVSALSLQQGIALAAVLVIAKVTLSVVSGYRDYLPPNFDSDFLLGREAYFFGAYRWAFYAHLVAGPLTLIFGTLLVWNGFRTVAPQCHRVLGRVQVAMVLLVLLPSGLWMARYAATGTVAGVGLAILAMATAGCAALGWRMAVRRRFEEHRQWMGRMYVLLCSAVVIRVIGGAASVLGVDAEWVYPVSVWVSWVGPLAIYESWQVVRSLKPFIEPTTGSLLRKDPGTLARD